MPQPDVLQLAKQGNPQAIAALMNHSLQSKGISIKTALAGDCLTITVESQEDPDQAASMGFIRKGIESLHLDSIKRVVVRGQATSSKAPAWRDAFSLREGSKTFSPTMQSSPITQPNEKPKLAPASLFAKVKQAVASVTKSTNSILLFGILVVGFLNLVGPERPAIVQWEYKIEGIEDLLFDSTMRQMGEDGWELVFARRATSGEGDSSRGLYECIFRRPSTPASRAEARAQERLEAFAAKQSEARVRVGSFARAQQAFYLENSRFALTFEELGIGLNKSSENYDYVVSVENPTKVLLTATAKNDGLKSYVGGAFFKKAGSLTGYGVLTTAITCETDKPSMVAPVSPQLVDDSPQCPSGTSEL